MHALGGLDLMRMEDSEISLLERSAPLNQSMGEGTLKEREVISQAGGTLNDLLKGVF